jgi:hypothetical protein
MRRVNYQIGVTMVFAVTLPSLLTGCMRSSPAAASSRQAALDNRSIASDPLPEIVITAQRTQPGAIVLSEPDVASSRASKSGRER